MSQTRREAMKVAAACAMGHKMGHKAVWQASYVGLRLDEIDELRTDTDRLKEVIQALIRLCDVQAETAKAAAAGWDALRKDLEAI